VSVTAAPLNLDAVRRVATERAARRDAPWPLVLALLDEVQRARPRPKVRRADRFGPAREYILANLGDPGLCPKSAARHLGITVSALNSMFWHRTGVSAWRWILAQRMEGAGRDLLDVAQVAVSAKVIAARWGFPDPRYFGRRFKAAYGVTPSEFRRRAQLARGVGL
jgi:AraC-like DNA-binding protein